MKKAHIMVVSLILIVTMLVSCETLALEDNQTSSGTSDYSAKQEENPAKQEENPESKFIGTWVYSDKNFGETAQKLGLKGWPSDSRHELSFSFRPNGTGTLSRITSAYGSDTEEKQEFIWYIDTLYDKRVYAIMEDNTAENYSLLYENELFLTMNTTDLGTMFFAKKQQKEIKPNLLFPPRQ